MTSTGATVRIRHSREPYYLVVGGLAATSITLSLGPQSGLDWAWIGFSATCLIMGAILTEVTSAVIVRGREGEIWIRASYCWRRRFEIRRIDRWAYHQRRRQLWLELADGSVAKSIVWISKPELARLADALAASGIPRDDSIL